MHVYIRLCTYMHTQSGLVVTMGFCEYYGQFVKDTSKCLRMRSMHMALYLQLFLWLGVYVHVMSNKYVWEEGEKEKEREREREMG